MIKKFKDWVNEGFWKDSINRAKTNTERLEDRLNTNIKDLIPIDLGIDIEFADRDFEMDGSYDFNHKQLTELNSYFEKYGWRIPTPGDIKLCRKKLDVYFTTKKKGLITQYMPQLINYKYTNAKVTFNSAGDYWLENGDEFSKHPWFWSVRPTVIDVSTDIYASPKTTLKIRLVRNKK